MGYTSFEIYAFILILLFKKNIHNLNKRFERGLDEGN